MYLQMKYVCTNIFYHVCKYSIIYMVNKIYIFLIAKKKNKNKKQLHGIYNSSGRQILTIRKATI